MNELAEIKKRIHKDNRIEELLEKLGCTFITPEKGDSLYTAARPDGDNRRSVQVKNTESLNSDIRSKGINGDIFDLVSYIKFRAQTPKELKDCIPKSKKWIIETLGYHEFANGTYKPRNELNGWLKSIRKKRTKTIDLEEVDDNEVIDESVKNEYIMIPHLEWIKEDITYETQKDFEVGYDLDSNRIVVMIRNRYGELIGVKGRTLDLDEEKKYLYLYKMNKSIELYNLHKAKPYIEEKKEVLIFEGFKSVMKAWQYGYRNCISIEGDSISDTQVALIKSLGLDVRIVLCFDKDKSVRSVKEQAKRITNREIYAVYDLDGLLSDKQSPVDSGKNVFDCLFRNKLLIPMGKIVLYN